MKKVILYIAMSLDGYIADRAGGVGWLRGDGSEPDNAGSYPAFYETVDTVILGYKTYRQIVTELSPDRWIYSGKKSYVLTHQTLPSTDQIEFTGKNPVQLVTELKQDGDGVIWICGGAAVANPLIDQDLIDEYCICMIPTILGDGIPLFGKREVETELAFVAAHPYDGIVDLVYRRRNKAF